MTKVWIDQDLCTGDGLCEEIAPDVFGGNSADGLWYVKEVAWKDIYEGSTDGTPTYKMAAGQAVVPDKLLDDVIEAADECPGACIFIEVDDE